MAGYHIELEGQALVLLGKFNPGIIQPAWLAHQGLIRPEESDSAKIDIIRSEISLFSIGSLKLLTQPEKFQIETVAVEESPTIKDLALGIFTVLEHTPLSALGINRDVHFKVESTDVWHAVGHRLVPKDVWKSIMEEPGTRSVIVRSNRPTKEGRLTVRVEPSARTQPGIYVGTNLHFNLERPQILQVLDKMWEQSQINARKAAETILEYCTG
ncbi:MAG: hypothetical protein HY423_01520 [Candidatus Lambdaproteobacteria bacterium]|nr:hypothetical protein [Candidatus Lambdaproteobacteria bacterium]